MKNDFERYFEESWASWLTKDNLPSSLWSIKWIMHLCYLAGVRKTHLDIQKDLTELNEKLDKLNKKLEGHES